METATLGSLFFGATGLIVGVAGWIEGRKGNARAARSEERERADRSRAAQELNQVYSMTRHLEWWVHNNPSTKDYASLANEVTAIVHLIDINLKENAKRYGETLRPTTPFPDLPEARPGPPSELTASPPMTPPAQGSPGVIPDGGGMPIPGPTRWTTVVEPPVDRTAGPPSTREL
jgi:hypothetical protein